MALNDFDKAISLTTELAARLKRGKLLSEFGNKQKAIVDYSVVLQDTPNNLVALYERHS